MLPIVNALRYVVPLREGGSLPGVMEADDEGTWVVKYRGAGQGVKVLVAEIIVAGLARALGIRVPDLKLVDMPEQIAKYEADEEVQDLLTASVGLNLGMDFLPGAFNYDGSTPPPPDEASAILWLDAYVANIDRTPHNPNLLRWGKNLWAIDHGAALYFHHSWPSRAPDPARFAAARFDDSSHILREVADDVSAVHERATAILSRELIARVLDDVPDEWLESTADLPGPEAVRAMYVEHLVERLARPDAWMPRNA